MNVNDKITIDTSFLERFIEEKTSFIKSNNWHRVSERMEKLKNCFDCRFKDDGTCADYNGPGEEGLCCCWYCMGSFGFLDSGILIDSTETIEDVTKQIISCWGENGFLSPSGCRLPRKNRSITCLVYHCGLKENRKGELTVRSKKLLEIIKQIEQIESSITAAEKLR